MQVVAVVVEVIRELEVYRHLEVQELVEQVFGAILQQMQLLPLEHKTLAAVVAEVQMELLALGVMVVLVLLSLGIKVSRKSSYAIYF
jgi:hypothetical protein